MPSAPPADPKKFSQADWARDFLTRLGAPVTPENMAAVIAWERAEGGHFVNNATYNPLNTTLDAPGGRAINSVGVKAYPDYETGINANVTTLTAPGNAGYGYPAIVAALRSGTDATGVLNALAHSKWGTGALALRFLQGARNDVAKGGGLANTAGDPANLLGQAKDATPLPGGDNPLTSLVAMVAKAAAWIANRHNWVRIIEIVGGAVLVLVGLAALTRDTWGPAAADAAAVAAV